MVLVLIKYSITLHVIKWTRSTSKQYYTFNSLLCCKRIPIITSAAGRGLGTERAHRAYRNDCSPRYIARHCQSFNNSVALRACIAALLRLMEGESLFSGAELHIHLFMSICQSCIWSNWPSLYSADRSFSHSLVFQICGMENVGVRVSLWQHNIIIIDTDAAWEPAEGIIAFTTCPSRQTMTRLFLDAAHKHYFLWYYWPLSSVLIIWIILQNPHFIQALWIF